jgi:DNA-binding transcriptional MocR family regulator
MWDNAYAVHDLAGKSDKLANVFEIAREYGNEDRIFYFSSTSKITFPSAGVAFFAVNKNNMDQIRPYLSAQTIGYDKLNQLRHVRFLKDAENVHRHMAELAKLVGRKFDIVLDVLSSLKGLGVADWTDPNGGYFISLNVMPGCARRVFELMKRAGVTLTPVGATFPYGVDPMDENLRIAPTHPSDEELKIATAILALSVRLASVEHYLK